MKRPVQFQAELSDAEIEILSQDHDDGQGADLIVRIRHGGMPHVPFPVRALWAYQALEHWLREHGGTMHGALTIPDNWGKPPDGEAEPGAKSSSV